MKIGEIGEAGLIKVLAEELQTDAKDVQVGIGDDTAVLALDAEQLLLATTDMLVAGEHFLPGKISPQALGHKALAVNLSDIAAMGGKARHALVAIGIPGDTEVEMITAIYQGMKKLAQEHGVNIVGGDTVRSPQGLVLNVTVLGEVEPANLTLRSNARVGDKILVTGDLGRAQAGLTVLQNDNLPVAEHLKQAALEKHCFPQPRLKEIAILLQSKALRAANDISDGLAKDLREITAASQVGAEIWPEKIPLQDTTIKIAEAVGEEPLNFALYGGEDFELLLTVNPAALQQVLKCGREAGISLTCIGEIKPASLGVSLKGPDGKRRLLKQGGWDHFQEGEQVENKKQQPGSN
jgi:thiamine-monophosphate kinase